MAGGACHICAAICALDVATARDDMHLAAKRGATIVEIRLDYLGHFNPHADLPELLRDRPLPAIVTYRPKWEGGKYTGDEDARREALRAAISLGAEFIDVELKVAKEFLAGVPPLQRRPHARDATRVIVSSHNYEETPSEAELGALVARLQEAGADVVKFATHGRNIVDNARVFRILSRCQVPLIALVMGPHGLLSRLLAPKFGAFLTFAALTAHNGSAPGQLLLTDLVDTYRLPRMGPLTKVFGLVGNPVKLSKGPLLHNAALAHAGVAGVYVPFLVEDDVGDFLAAFRSPDFAGFSVTLPHKEAAVRICDEVDPMAKAIGAVNTIVRRPGDGKLVGYNTDWDAAICAIERGLTLARQGSAPEAGDDGTEGRSPLDGSIMVVVGAGGTGRALAFGARQRGARVVIANRSLGKAQGLAKELGADAIALSELGQSSTVRALVAPGPEGRGFGKGPALVLANTTSVGMRPDVEGTPVPKEVLGHFTLVFDAVYAPVMTRLLREAEREGAATVSGLRMFVGQAAKQFELFTGLPAPLEVIEDVITRSLQTA